MRRRLIVSDIDGTLLRDDKTISEKTRLKIESLISKGHAFAIATGRMHGAGRIITEKLDYDGFLISCNGAVVKHLKTGEVIQAVEIPIDHLRKVTEICKKHDAYFHFYDINAIYTEKQQHLALKYAQGMWKLPEALQFEVHFVGDIEALIGKFPVYKVGLYSENPQTFKAIIDEINALGTVETCKSLETSFDVMAKGISKASGIAALCEYYGIQQQEVIAFGDNENDVDMIDYAGIGVAMDNAAEMLKAVADFVTLSNEEDGLVYALDQFIEKE